MRILVPGPHDLPRCRRGEDSGGVGRYVLEVDGALSKRRARPRGDLGQRQAVLADQQPGLARGAELTERELLSAQAHPIKSMRAQAPVDRLRLGDLTSQLPQRLVK